MKMTKEGIKYDDGKLRLAEMMVDFKLPMEELCKVWTFGANKYSKSNWKKVDNGRDRYTNALMRHLLAEEDNLYDEESNLLHASHIAFNALARLYFILGKTKSDTEIDDICNAHLEESKRYIPYKGEVPPWEYVSTKKK